MTLQAQQYPEQWYFGASVEGQREGRHRPIPALIGSGQKHPEWGQRPLCQVLDRSMSPLLSEVLAREVEASCDTALATCEHCQGTVREVHGGAMPNPLLLADQHQLAATQARGGMESKINKGSEMASLISLCKLKGIQSVNKPPMKTSSDSHQSGGCWIQQFSFQLCSNGK